MRRIDAIPSYLFSVQKIKKVLAVLPRRSLLRESLRRLRTARNCALKRLIIDTVLAYVRIFLGHDLGHGTLQSCFYATTIRTPMIVELFQLNSAFSLLLEFLRAICFHFIILFHQNHGAHKSIGKCSTDTGLNQLRPLTVGYKFPNRNILFFSRLQSLHSLMYLTS